jgi:hypothetical protein
MLRATKTKSQQKRRTRFPGICTDAELLGVSREHLYRVLTGERESKSLLERYRALAKKGQHGASLEATSSASSRSLRKHGEDVAKAA